jgi:ferredoxin
MFGRGTAKEVGPAYMEASDDCIACGACAYVCPTKCIHVIDNADGSRTIDRWKRTLPLAVCEKTGRKFTPRYLLEHLGQKMGGLGHNVLAKAPPYR